MSNIESLLNKYYKKEGANLTAHQKINKAEKHTPKYNKKLKREQYRRNRHLILKQLLNEIPFTLKPYQIKQIQYWIDRFNDDFKSFHRNSSNETILLAFIMIQQMQADKGIKINKYKISKKYNLTLSKFETIQNQLIFRLMKTTELRHSQSRYYNHEKTDKETE